VSFEILQASGTDAARWTALIQSLDAPQRDVHFLPEYGRVYARTYGQEPFLAVIDDGSGFAAQPFVRRELNGLPFLREQAVSEPLFDIANPYGYGGPVWKAQSEQHAAALYRALSAELKRWCCERGFASEFSSLHPLLGNQRIVAAAGIETTPVKEIVYVDCAAGDEALWAGMNRGHKSNLRRAQKSGVSVSRVDPTAANLAEFSRLYFLTMERNQATDRWYFPKAYFRNCFDELGEARMSLFFARAGDRLAGAYLLMHDFGTAYYHFAGSDPECFEQRASNALMFETARWVRQQGYGRYHLGGGVGSDPSDALFRFKAGFSPLRTTLHSYGRVLDPAAYQRLSELKMKHEITTSGAASASAFFPAYRR